MDQLSAAELLELIHLGESSIDSQFQFWLTTTFATIVGVFAGREVLSQRMRLMVCGLYLLATFVFVSRWFYDGLDPFRYNTALADAGIILPAPRATLLSRLLLFAFGTAATLYFVLRRSQQLNAEEDG